MNPCNQSTRVHQWSRHPADIQLPIPCLDDKGILEPPIWKQYCYFTTNLEVLASGMNLGDLNG